ncbi:MAG: ribbon-helix-helix domain-containing protein [Nanoarchaeota archaeon]
METICIKLDEELVGSIDRSVKDHNFGTRTEFIRAAIREKLESMTREELINHFLGFHGKSKKKLSDEEWAAAREMAFEELMNKKKRV